MIGQKGPGRSYPGDTCYHRDADDNRDCKEERCWVRNGKMRSTLCRAHETEKNNKAKREYLQSGANTNRNRLRRQEEEDEMLELIAFPDPSKYLELIAELCKPKIDRRTREHRKSTHVGPLGRARLGAA